MSAYWFDSLNIWVSLVGRSSWSKHLQSFKITRNGVSIYSRLFNKLEYYISIYFNFYTGKSHLPSNKRPSLTPQSSARMLMVIPKYLWYPASRSPLLFWITPAALPCSGWLWQTYQNLIWPNSAGWNPANDSEGSLWLGSCQSPNSFILCRFQQSNFQKWPNWSVRL